VGPAPPGVDERVGLGEHEGTLGLRVETSHCSDPTPAHSRISLGDHGDRRG